MRKILAPIALGAAGLAAVAAAAPPPASAWQIGPVIRGKNYSINMPATMQPGPNGPWFAFPLRGQGEVHYVTLPVGSLKGARSISLRYRIDAAPGTRLVAANGSASGTFGLAIQRTGDNWSARGRYETYRWYSPQAPVLTPGTHTFTARLDDPRWIGVLSSTAGGNPRAFAEALAEAQSVSMTFGGGGGRGHGVYATAPARFTLLDFSIE
ncbi:hypothetical protein N0B51_05710 [Tsuneonella sp. YG55]|uniref:Uncharacterized protein n=1 Tax=Tsuneonella litorea TaxID=2976475 RepID=A0A9X2W0A9_9SPHN|nr:hypothetical protein [Tsuneonella litorea]MCT2558471.1 hypothetical protein [Tsuneonella litorea]